LSHWCSGGQQTQSSVVEVVPLDEELPVGAPDWVGSVKDMERQVERDEGDQEEQV
jgi:hypothetical protein